MIGQAVRMACSSWSRLISSPAPGPRPARIRFAAEQPNQCWQADFTDYRLTRPDGRPGPDTEILCWLDDHFRYALSVRAHVWVTGPIVLAEFRKAVAIHGTPASTLTDNGMVFTTRYSGGCLHGTPGRNGYEHELRRLGVPRRTPGPTTYYLRQDRAVSVRHVAPGCIPGLAGRDSKGGSWV